MKDEMEYFDINKTIQEIVDEVDGLEKLRAKRRGFSFGQLRKAWSWPMVREKIRWALIHFFTSDFFVRVYSYIPEDIFRDFFVKVDAKRFGCAAEEFRASALEFMNSLNKASAGIRADWLRATTTEGAPLLDVITKEEYEKKYSSSTQTTSGIQVGGVKMTNPFAPKTGDDLVARDKE